MIKFFSNLWQIVGFSGYSGSSTNEIDRHDMTKILLKVALNTIILPFYHCCPIWTVLFQVIGNSKDEQQTKKNQQKLHELIELLCRLNRVRDDHLTFRAARTRLFFLPLKNQIFFLHDKSAFFSNFTKISC